MPTLVEGDAERMSRRCDQAREEMSAYADLLARMNAWLDAPGEVGLPVPAHPAFDGVCDFLGTARGRDEARRWMNARTATNLVLADTLARCERPGDLVVAASLARLALSDLTRRLIVLSAREV